MPVTSVWIVPTLIAVGVTQYYLIALTSLVEAALVVSWLPDTPLNRRGKFKTGGKTAWLCAGQFDGTTDLILLASSPRSCCCHSFLRYWWRPPVIRRSP